MCQAIKAIWHSDRVKACPDERACPLGSEIGGQILQGLPVNVVHTAELMNRRACPTMPAACEVLYDKHGAKHCQENIVA